MSKVVLAIAPSETPISLANVESHLRWDDADGSDAFDSDAQLTQMISDALDVAETFTWSRFVTQTWDLYLDVFPGEIVLPYPPASSITSIKYHDTGDVEQTLSADVYELGERNGVGIVRLKYQQRWPATLSHPDVIIVKYVCGYGGASSVPDAITHALKMIVTSLATHRGDADAALIPDAAKALLSQYSFRAISS